MFRRKKGNGRRAPKSLRRSFVTPEGVDLQLDLGGAGERAAAFIVDVLLILAILIGATLLLALIARNLEGDGNSGLVIVWLLGFFVLRNGWFILFELGGRGATPGKRLLGLRVVARDGARLTGGAVIVRNAMREIEIFLPLSFLAVEQSASTADKTLTIFALLWSGIFLFFPLFNRDRLRVGDLLAGTWVVHVVRAVLARDLVSAPVARERWVFGDGALRLYGVFELQTLEEVLRRGDSTAIHTVAASIRRKADMPDHGDDYDFLFDYYAALCARLERDMLLGRRRVDKFQTA
jgi:uncharacterized RDD family membrane protein YckC